MLGSTILETIVGLMLIYLLLSLVVTALNEWVAQLFNLRASSLFNGIQHLLGDDLTQRLYAHHLIAGLSSNPAGAKRLLGESNRPSYIPPDLFAIALLDVLDPADANHSRRDMAKMRTVIANPPSDLPPEQREDSDRVKRTLLPILASAGNDCSRAQKAIETWFSQANERITGQYARRLRIITIAFACVIALVLNADTLKLAGYISTNDAVRNILVEKARLAAQNSSAGDEAEPSEPDAGPLTDSEIESSEPEAEPPADSEAESSEPDAEQLAGEESEPSESRDELSLLSEDLALPFRWDDEELRRFPFSHMFVRESVTSKSNATSDETVLSGPGWMLEKTVGLVLTIAAISLGAPFWFDTLNRFVNIRSSGPAPKGETDRGLLEVSEEAQHDE